MIWFILKWLPPHTLSYIDSNDISEVTLQCAQFRNQEMVRIGLRDIYQQERLGSIVHDISELSDAIIQTIAKACFSKHNRPDLLDQQVIIGMGKLGGYELNYSSDIDLIFVCINELSDEDKSLLKKIYQDFIQALTTNQNLGQLFRVDMRLRPYGSSGALFMSLSGSQKYYDKEAHPWEWQAWIKARILTGNLKLGAQIIYHVQSILFNPENHSAIISDIHRLRKIQYDILDKSNESDREVKLGPGGIRAIEFFVQSLQIQHATQYPDLISGHTMHALNRLVHHDLINSDVFTTLQEAYVFFRRIEHRLQLLGFQQNHLLPEDTLELNKIAKRMGYEDTVQTTATEVFLKDYQDTRHSVIQIVKPS